ncbi:hypothetical protein Bca52824_011648 [Brassica carinata]|uniref:Uncharacterized protein n=1 Tax=Brassica carinata TaxID=52824 RepID=A0A8X7VX61_BRACI|nr:hypothetical protein Bca52824_011648 [Brassica carinata]
MMARFKSDRILTTGRYFQDNKSPRPLIAVKPLVLRWRISHKRRYLECKAFFTETPSKHEAIQVYDVRQSAELISHGSVDMPDTSQDFPTAGHHRLTYVADQRRRCSYPRKRKVGEKKAHTTMRRTCRRLETQPRVKIGQGMYSSVFGA